MNKIRGGIIGADIGYSKSPELYNNYFRDNVIDGEYEIIDLKTNEELRDFVVSGRIKEYNFLNITQPYKGEFLKYLTQSDIIVNETQSVNLVLIDGDDFEGYNTDAEGFYSYYFDRLVGCNVSEILLVGTGAMSRTAKTYIQQATPANLSVMSPRNNPIPEFFKDLTPFHPENTDGPSMCYRFDLMIFAASHKAEKMVADMPIKTDKIINLNYQTSELEEFAMLNGLPYVDGKFMLLEQFKENLKILNIFDKDYDFDKLMERFL
jgi:shikimate dehydrogenase